MRVSQPSANGLLILSSWCLRLGHSTQCSSARAAAATWHAWRAPRRARRAAHAPGRESPAVRAPGAGQRAQGMPRAAHPRATGAARRQPGRPRARPAGARRRPRRPPPAPARRRRSPAARPLRPRPPPPLGRPVRPAPGRHGRWPAGAPMRVPSPSRASPAPSQPAAAQRRPRSASLGRQAARATPGIGPLPMLEGRAALSLQRHGRGRMHGCGAGPAFSRGCGRPGGMARPAPGGSDAPGAPGGAARAATLLTDPDGGRARTSARPPAPAPAGAAGAAAGGSSARPSHTRPARTPTASSANQRAPRSPHGTASGSDHATCARAGQGRACESRPAARPGPGRTAAPLRRGRRLRISPSGARASRDVYSPARRCGACRRPSAAGGLGLSAD